MSSVSANLKAAESAMLNDVSIEEPWAFVELASSLVRLSGRDDERKAIDYLTGKLDQFGVSYQLHTPTLFVSWPLGATLRVLGENPVTLLAKTPSMSVSTGGEEVEGELLYLPTGWAKGIDDFFATPEMGNQDFTGKVVITEGMPMPMKVADIAKRGAIAAVFVGPGERIHEGVCTTIWGSPDLDSMDRQPLIPIIAVNRPEGLALIERTKAETVRVAFSTDLDTRWRPIPILVAEINGTERPDEFVMLHGHLDSWHVGIGDNATGDATLLEVARVLGKHRDALTRSVRIAWWSGHSHGRYAGSTWYADNFGLDLVENCVALVNCDSPGCRWASVFTDMMWTEEADPFARQVVQDVTGQEPTWSRPLRAGDYSFFNLGITGYFMLSSTMTAELRAEKGYYQVGGCGGNIAWHTEDDTIEIADRDNLVRDMRLYAAGVFRAAALPVVPFDYGVTLDGFARTIADYQQQAGEHFDFSSAVAAIEALAPKIDRFNAGIAALSEADANDPRAIAAGAAIRKLARLLIPINYARESQFVQDPAEHILPLPDLVPAKRIARLDSNSHEYHATRISLRRGLNRLNWALRQTDEVIESSGIAG
jgi:hypothetical protein